MPKAPESQPIVDLARRVGVLTEWVDAWGNPNEVDVADLRSVIGAVVGMDVSTDAGVVAASLQLDEDAPPLEPVVVAWDGVLKPVPFLGTISDAVCELEDGSTREARIVNQSIVVSGELPIGYHRLNVEGGRYGAHVFAAPTEVPSAPSGAIGLTGPTYSLSGSIPDAGIGSVSHLRAMADLCHSVGVQVVGTLPLLATFDDDPSPYSPVSRRAWGELLVDFSAIPGWDEPTPVSEDDPSWVDYGAVSDRVGSALRMYSAHVSSTPSLRAQVDEFLATRPEVSDYAHFRAVSDRYGREWRNWPQGVVAAPERVAYHESVQWLLHLQLSELAEDLAVRHQHLYLDLPIGCHRDGYDVWSEPDLYSSASLGAPPDLVFRNGQDWDLSAPIPRRSRESGHLHLRKAIGHQLSVAGLLRIDHVIGLHRSWWIPDGSGPNHGAYVKQPTEELFAIVAIEAVRAGAGIIGENLGTVPPEINEGMDQHGLLGMSIALFGPTDPRSEDVISISSHDMPAFAAWWDGTDLEDLAELGVFDDEALVVQRRERARAKTAMEDLFKTETPVETRNALMAWAAKSDAAIVLVSIDDLLMELRRQNVPGTSNERPNWRLRYDRSIDDLSADPSFTGLLKSLVALRSASPRA